MADISNSKPPTEALGNTDSLAQRCLRFLRKGKMKDVVNPQIKSPLFSKLPRELRDHIWQIAFERTEDTQPAHLHVYDEVYDACTYQNPRNDTSKDRVERRKAQAQIAVLMSCRRIYEEASPFLYDQSDFTLVVCAGTPRDHCSGSNRACKSLGRLEKCERLFRRIKNLTLIIQPGRNPHLGLYITRLQNLLHVIDYGSAFRELTIVFNYRLEIAELDADHIKRKQIVEALYPLRENLAPRIETKKCFLTIISWKVEQSIDPLLLDDGEENKYVTLLRHLGNFDKDRPIIADETDKYASTVEGGNAFLWGWSPGSTVDRENLVLYGADKACLERGVFGEDNYALTRYTPMSRTPSIIPHVTTEQIGLTLFCAGYIATLPLSLPITVYAYTKRKRRKGEWK